ncbi:hypothetical protein E3P78_01540 [Wallemia ichthyophaga]|nr:hypothetical protein E3P78_01540 [Wallemia ichthyophaga]
MKDTIKTQTPHQSQLSTFGADKKRTADAVFLPHAIPHLSNLKEVTLTLGHFKSVRDCDVLGSSKSVKYLTIMIEVIKSDDANLIARELCDRYSNIAQLNIYRYENAYRGFTPPKKKRFMVALEYALRHTNPLPHLKTVLFKYYERHMEYTKQSWKAFKEIKDMKRIVEVLAGCHTNHAFQFDGSVFELLKAISRQLQEEYHTSKEFNTHITPDVFHTALLSVISNYRPNHEPNLRVMLEATSEIDELNDFDLVLEEIFFTAIGTARIGGHIVINRFKKTPIMSVNRLISRLNKTLYFELTDDRTIFGQFTLIDKEKNVIVTNAREVTNSTHFQSELSDENAVDADAPGERWVGIVMIPRHRVKAVYE